ncbi:MAG: hypothetical protein LBM62_04240 [Mediterranea sp.]|jgi:hypothetical protein|nr:hypothetical protein [Mediterranea sp.]
MTTKQIINQLSPVLFWDIDTEQLDMDKHAGQLIARVLEYGMWEDWKLILSFYGLNRIVREMKQVRSLDPVALSYICALSDTKKEDYRCYHFRQSNPTLWNS